MEDIEEYIQWGIYNKLLKNNNKGLFYISSV